MTNRLEALEDWAAGLLGQLEPASRNKLVRSVGRALRCSQQQRIIAQKNPDGSKYAPRKQRNIRGKQGRVRRKVKMFKKLRTASLMQTYYDADEIYIGFTGRVARIAQTHQYGLSDRPERGAPVVKYNQRELLGFTKRDISVIRDLLLYELTK